MEKEDILLKSKNDNRKGDELQVQNKQNAEMFGYGSVMFVLVVLMVMGSDFVSGEIRIGSMTMLFYDFITLLVGLSLVCEFGAKFYFARRWWQLLLALFSLPGLFSISSGINYKGVLPNYERRTYTEKPSERSKV